MTGRSNPADNRLVSGTASERSFDAAIHLTSFIPMMAAIPIAGRPHLLLAPLAIAGPLLAGWVLASSRTGGRQHRARAIETATSFAIYAIACFLILTAGARYQALSLLLPLGAVLLLALILNWLAFTLIAANRARYGELFDPPGVIALPAWLRGEPHTSAALRH